MNEDDTLELKLVLAKLALIGQKHDHLSQVSLELRNAATSICLALRYIEEQAPCAE